MFSKFYDLTTIVIILLCSHEVINSIERSSHIVDLFSSKKNHYDYLLSKLSRYKRQLIRDNSQSCQIPYKPFNTKYEILENSTISYTLGDYVPIYYTLKVSCGEGYNLSPFANKYSICVNGTWDLSPATCSRTCPSLSSTASTTVQCSYDGKKLSNCFNPVNKTKAILACTPFYEEASIDRNPIRVCRNGKWNPPIPQCYPSCGMKTPKGTPNIINGTNAPLRDYPWQVGVYNTRKELICGGSIIQENVVLSAAHCFTDHRGNTHPITNYYIAAGKYYREYEDDRDQSAQYSNVLFINVPENYKGNVHFYGSDIAVIVLADPFKLSKVVQPVCVVLNERMQDIDLQLNDNGIVTGWGYTEEGRKLSEELKELVIPYIPYQNCFNEVSENFRKYITSDKICGGYINRGTSICQGDSGGALVFKNPNNNRYYVKGIVSTSPATIELVCNSNTYSLYTAVSHHITFVQFLVQSYQRQQPVEFTPEDDEIIPEIQSKQQSVEFTSQSNSTDQEIENQSGCRFPSSPPNGKYVYLHLDNNQITPGDYIPIGSAVMLSCNLGYEDISSRTVRSYCVDNERWMPMLTTCKKSEVNFTADCFVLGEKGIGNCTDLKSCRTVENAINATFPDVYEIYKRYSFLRRILRKYQCGYSASGPKACCYTTDIPPENLNENIEELTNSSHDFSNHKNINLLPKECGVHSSDNRTDSGNKTNLFEFPWMANFIYTTPNGTRWNISQCSGTIINDRYILTAARCILYYTFNDARYMIGVTVGVYSFTSEPSCEIKDENTLVCADPRQEIEIEDAIVHHHHDLFSIANNVALVRLRRPLQFTRSVQPICLPISDQYRIEDFTNTSLKLTGWGSNFAYDSKNSDLHQVEVIVQSYGKCEQIFRTDFSKIMLCANSSSEKISICIAEQGEPLQSVKYVNDTPRYFQFGIYMYDYACEHILLTRVDYFMSWILDNIKK